MLIEIFVFEQLWWLELMSSRLVGWLERDQMKMEPQWLVVEWSKADCWNNNNNIEMPRSLSFVLFPGERLVGHQIVLALDVALVLWASWLTREPMPACPHRFVGLG